MVLLKLSQVLLLVLLFNTGLTVQSGAQTSALEDVGRATKPTKSPFSQLVVPDECTEAYQQGLKEHQEAILSGYDFKTYESRIAFYEKVVADGPTTEDCQFYTSLGLHDAQSTVRLQTLQEFMLEYRMAKEEGTFDTKRWGSLLGHYHSRLEAIGLDEPSDLKSLMSDESVIRQSNDQLTKALNEIADERDEAVPFGRFLFVGQHSAGFTAYDFTFDEDGTFQTDDSGREQLAPGSYQRSAARLFASAIQNAKEYLDWHPSIFFGDDAHWRGSIVRYFQSNPEPTVREIKEDMYLGSMNSYLKQARQLRLNTEPFSNMYRTMLHKQTAVLERDVAAYERVEKAKWAAPLVPVGMYFGAALLVKTGWALAIPAETAAFSYLGGSLAYAANSSAAVSLSVIGGYAGVGAIQAWQARQQSAARGQPFNLTTAADLITFASLESFHLAAVAPVVFGGLALGGQQGWVAGRSLLTNSIQSGRLIAQTGLRQNVANFKHFLVQLPGRVVRMPGIYARQWLTTWWKEPKLLFTYYGADVLITVGYECGYRQVSRQGDRKCWYRDQNGELKVNHHFLYKLGTSMIISPLAQPLILIPGFGKRWIAYSAFYAFADLMVHLSVSGSVDWDRYAFDRMFTNSVGTVVGEINRSFMMSDFVRSKSVPSQIGLIILFRVLAIRPVTMPLDLALFEAYEEGRIGDLAVFRELIEEHALIDLTEYSDGQIQEAAFAFSQIPKHDLPLPIARQLHDDQQED